MRIVIDARELRTTTGRYVERLLHYLQKLDNQHQYMVLLKPKDFDGWEPVNENFQKAVCRFKEFTFGEQLGLWLQLRRLSPDLVHFVMAQQPVLYRRLVVTTMNDLTTLRFRNPSKSRLVFTIKQFVYRWLNKVVARKSAAILTFTEFVKADVAKFGHINSRKITVTNLAADKIIDAAEPVEGLDEDSQFIMYVGRPLPHKNLDRLIEAYKKLKAAQPALKLVLVGKTDTLYKRIRRNTQAAGVEDVIFTGFVTEGQLRWLYEHSQVYVFPSLSEGFGLPGLEAMLHGAPVASSNATCLPEVYGDAAIYFDPQNVDDMAEKIQQLLDDEALRNKLITKGYDQAGKYSWEHMAEQTLEVYSQVTEVKQSVEDV